MEILFDTKFAKYLSGFVIFLGASMMLTIVTGIFIATGEPATTCIPFSAATIASILSTAYFARKMDE